VATEKLTWGRSLAHQLVDKSLEFSNKRKGELEREPMSHSQVHQRKMLQVPNDVNKKVVTGSVVVSLDDSWDGLDKES